MFLQLLEDKKLRMFQWSEAEMVMEMERMRRIGMEKDGDKAIVVEVLSVYFLFDVGNVVTKMVFLWSGG